MQGEFMSNAIATIALSVVLSAGAAAGLVVSGVLDSGTKTKEDSGLVSDAGKASSNDDLSRLTDQVRELNKEVGALTRSNRGLKKDVADLADRVKAIESKPKQIAEVAADSEEGEGTSAAAKVGLSNLAKFREMLEAAEELEREEREQERAIERQQNVVAARTALANGLGDYLGRIDDANLSESDKKAITDAIVAQFDTVKTYYEGVSLREERGEEIGQQERREELSKFNEETMATLKGTLREDQISAIEGTLQRVQWGLAWSTRGRASEEQMNQWLGGDPNQRRRGGFGGGGNNRRGGGNR